ncbi:type I 3-dehydroquinate dehydratase [Brevibacterium daeguense]|uniref:type I 3-dehydroquinate dehydratase n=1 Tax=Brevibacterium daeguense TaxID=909936 RepID=UPI001F022119|nr:type I 3-dehydroquinate dehydratase [Brevibacterium daeguense]
MKSLPFVPADVFPAVIVPLTPRDAAELADQAARAAATEGVDVIEWRVDALDEIRQSEELGVDGLDAVRAAVTAGWEALQSAASDLPVLMTLRTTIEGGYAPVTEEAYAALLDFFIGLGPTAVDIEFQRTAAEDLIARAAAAEVCSFASFHDFEQTPPAEHLIRLMARMEKAGANVAKIAVMPNHRTDVLEVLSVADRAQATLPIPVVAIAMGRLGKATRLVGGEFGSAATFAAVGEISAPGQLRVPHVLAALESLRADEEQTEA